MPSEWLAASAATPRKTYPKLTARRAAGSDLEAGVESAATRRRSCRWGRIPVPRMFPGSPKSAGSEIVPPARRWRRLARRAWSRAASRPGAAGDLFNSGQARGRTGVSPPPSLTPAGGSRYA